MANDELLDEFGTLEGTDKGVLFWDYLTHYEEVFSLWRDREFTLIEIGVGGGNSLNAWRRYFSRAVIVGVDIVEEARRAAKEGILIEIGSQTDGPFLDMLCERYSPSIIIDDGSHQAEHILFTFRRMFPNITPGGWYVIEDLKITGGQESVLETPHQFFSNISQLIMHCRLNEHPEHDLVRNIERIVIAAGVVCIRKRSPDMRKMRIRRAAGLVRRTLYANNFHWLADILMNEQHDLEAAEVAARRAVELYFEIAIYHLGLSEVLEKRGDVSAATDEARTAIEVEPKNYACQLRLGSLLAKSNDLHNAAIALDESIKLAPQELRGFVKGERLRILGQ